ncbi:MAG: histidine--tRNA ligase [Candidatus Nomurabacteria bacterium]|jgi:histidyl-tRNA synthetase|nr:histidine--tRNA ligase [Candidatus Nomurabacteria bacterium]
MQRPNTATLSGFMDLTPEYQAAFDKIKQTIANVHSAYGFSSIDTPLIYRKEILLAKAGGDTEKQIYEMTRGETDLALRFDQTVPLAVYVANKQSELAFPFKVSQIGKVYRGERSQKGRFREFYQCDADVIGRGELPIAYDAEVIAILNDIFTELDLGKFTIRIANRKLLLGFLESLDLTDGQRVATTSAIDHAEKISGDEFKEMLREIGLDEERILRVFEFIELDGTNADILRNLTVMNITNDDFKQGLRELREVTDLLAAYDNVKIDLMIVRGLDYYTGTVFETILDKHPEIGSVGSGGRYDNLCDNYTSEKFQGVGGSVGLSRLFYVLTEIGLVKPSVKTSAEILVIPFGESQIGAANLLANKLRGEGKRVMVLYDGWKIGKKMEFANKIAVPFVAVIGENEVTSGRYGLKNMVTGEEVQEVL